MQQRYLIYGGAGIALLCVAYFVFSLLNDRSELRNSVAETTANLETTKKELGEKIVNLEGELASKKDEYDALLLQFQAEKEKNDAFEGQIRDISSTVGDLDKLSKTDPELLQKYSKVYFLNEHYIPPKIVEIEKKYTYDQARTYEIHAEVWPHLEDMLDDAKKDGIDISVVSAYRSFGTQAALKSNYNVTYGAGTANQFSADQGYSEHQLGTTLDFTTPTLGANFSSFEISPAYEWLTKNAHKYGFTLSYPKTNTYYQFEPWHWRYVGEDLARDLYKDDKHFYDLDQREIDQYLISIFD